QYEVSAWSRDNEHSRHNTNYWSFGDYIGIGAGAHGKHSLLDGRMVRRWKTRLPADYLDRQKPYLAGEAVVSQEELPVEFFMNALRLRDGVPADWFTERTGLPLSYVADTLARLRAQGLLVNDSSRLATTKQGFRHLDTVLQAFM
ncbi:MAG: YggW family oxidoreductase, partial [Gammaproteobacteria bacterium]